MSKSPDAFRSIGEVSRLVGVAPHVLRYWETQFSQLAPVKRADGRRYYRPDDVRLVAGLYQVMREEGLSIRGAKRLIAADRGTGLREIGAARLGETREDAATAQPATPAVRLAVPEPAPAALQPPARPVRISRVTSREPESLPLFAGLEPAAAPAQPSVPSPSVPSPTPDWLSRLAATALALRQHEWQDRTLPATAKALHDALQNLCQRA
uniref:MerR family transcriptional regulator n=1 Tax=Paracoccus sp. TRP TaxID=412597 RepID=UPI000225F960|nr:MerR family transcriptional regulator [Paracoccus sp. TRP]